MKYPHSTHLPSLLALACLTALGTPAFANDDIETESVVVTGSRIVNPNVISPSPISTLSADDIKASGAVNIGDVLTKMPQLATTFTMGNSGGSNIGTAGIANQNLRNMGSDRTLVLVNGRRFVGSSAGSTAVDTNLIPASWIERVEVLTGGASAVYGADAVTGVVNFILKKNYEGLESNAQFGLTEAGHKKRAASLTGGTNFADDRGNVAFSVERSEQDALSFRKRFGNESYRFIKDTGNGYGRTLLPNGGLYIYSEGGTFVDGSGQRYVFNADGTHREQRFDGAKDNTACSNCDHLDLNQVMQLEPEYNRSSVNGVASFDISENHRVFFEGTYSEIDVQTFGQPTFSSSAPYLIAADNAYLSPSLAQLTQEQEEGVIAIQRFDTDAGQRGSDSKRKTSRVVIGAEGFISEDWAYDGHINYGVTEDARANLNNRIEDRFYAAIDAVRDPNTNQIVCRSTLEPKSVNANTGTILDNFATAGCVPTSILGAGAINAAARDWFNTTTHTDGRLTQYVAGGTVSNNNLFEMPGDAGSASLVVGSEYRRETSREITDPLDRAGRTFFNAIPSSRGTYDVQEGFAQLGLPVLTDKFLAKSLSLDAAARYSDYSSIGATKAWRYGFDWGIDDNVRLRGTKSVAVRAPNIGELYKGQSESFSSLKDPCSSEHIKNTKNPALRAANCAKFVPAGFTSSVGSSRRGIQGSNSNLDPETGETWTLGVVLTPTFIPDFSLTVDYWDIELTNAITLLPGQKIVDRCVDSPSGIDNAYCQNVTRTNGEVSFIRSIAQNITASTSAGYDIAASYKHELLGGELKYNLYATQVRDYTSYPYQDAPSANINELGELEQGAPEWKGQLNLSYVYDALSLSWSQRHSSSLLRVTNEVYQSNPRSQTPYHTASANFSDIRASYEFDDALQGYFGITNVFDRKPPVNLYGTDEGSALYDAMGRGYYTGVNYTF